MAGSRRLFPLVLPLGLLGAGPGVAADPPPTIRVGNLANKGELARFERRVWEGCGREADIRIERRASDRKPGRVIGQHPPKGTRIGCDNARATLILSAGPPDGRIFVPALVEPERRRAFVRQLRTACGAAIAITEVRKAAALPSGRFLGQSPAQGEPYRCGEPLQVTLSAGPEAAPRAASRPPARTQLDQAPPPNRPETAARPPAPQALRAPPQQPPPDPAEPPPPAAGPPASPQAQASRQPAPPPAPAARPPAVASEPVFLPGLAVPVLLLLAAAVSVALLRRRPRLAPAPPATVSPIPPLPAQPAPLPIAPLLSVERGWPTAESSLRPAARTPSGPPADLLPPTPLLRDLLRPLDPVLDLIADTPIAALQGAGPPPGAAADTLAPLRADFAEALRFALLFELAPLLADAWAAAPELPFEGSPRRGWSRLAPHSIEVRVTPDLRLKVAGVPLVRPRLAIRLCLTFTEARLFLRGSALDAFEPGATHASAVLDWAGSTRPLAVLRPHAEWPGSQPVVPPRQLSARQVPGPRTPARALTSPASPSGS